jgi:hypothetical protein
MQTGHTESLHPPGHEVPEIRFQSVGPLCFYPGFELAVSEDRNRFAVRSSDKLVRLNWTNEPIYRLNDAGALHLTRETLFPYVRFFFDFVRGGSGCFSIAEPDEAIPWLRCATRAQKESVRNQLIPLRYDGLDESAMHSIRASVIFRDALFHCDIKIARTPSSVFDAELGRLIECTFGCLLLTNEVLIQEHLDVAMVERPKETS